MRKRRTGALSFRKADSEQICLHLRLLAEALLSNLNLHLPTSVRFDTKTAILSGESK